MRKFTKPEEDAEINMTPMLDVVFIMLIFFIVTASFVKEHGLSANKPPEAPETDEPPDPDKENVLIQIDNNSRIRIKLARVDIGGVRALIQQGRAKNPQAMVIIQAEPNAESGVMIRIYDMALQADVPPEKITLNKKKPR